MASLMLGAGSGDQCASTRLIGFPFGGDAFFVGGYLGMQVAKLPTNLVGFGGWL